MRKIAVITGSRADESPLSNVIRLLGDSAVHIRTEGLLGHEAPLKDRLEKTRPDIVLLLGDRYETLVAASVAALLTIPIAHIHGGEETTGAVDNTFRHAITKLAYWHFTAHKDYSKRIIQMGEAPDRVFAVGAPGVDALAYPDLMSLEECEKEMGEELRTPIMLVSYHPETSSDTPTASQLEQSNLPDLVECWPGKVIISGSNADIGGDIISKQLQGLADSESKIYRPSFGSRLWLSLMYHAAVLVGNSSSFIFEGKTLLNKRIIMIGERQKGRWQEAQRHFAVNEFAYGVMGHVSEAIVNKLMTLPIPSKPRKAFHDIAY